MTHIYWNFVACMLGTGLLALIKSVTGLTRKWLSEEKIKKSGVPIYDFLRPNLWVTTIYTAIIVCQYYSSLFMESLQYPCKYTIGCNHPSITEFVSQFLSYQIDAVCNFLRVFWQQLQMYSALCEFIISTYVCKMLLTQGNAGLMVPRSVFPFISVGTTVWYIRLSTDLQQLFLLCHTAQQSSNFQYTLYFNCLY